MLSMCSPVIMYASNLGWPFDFSLAASGCHCSLSFSSGTSWWRPRSGSCSAQLPLVVPNRPCWWWALWTAGSGLGELWWTPGILVVLSPSPVVFTESRCFRTVAFILGSMGRNALVGSNVDIFFTEVSCLNQQNDI